MTGREAQGEVSFRCLNYGCALLLLAVTIPGGGQDKKKDNVSSRLPWYFQSQRRACGEARRVSTSVEVEEIKSLFPLFHVSFCRSVLKGHIRLSSFKLFEFILSISRLYLFLKKRCSFLSTKKAQIKCMSL